MLEIDHKIVQEIANMPTMHSWAAWLMNLQEEQADKAEEMVLKWISETMESEGAPEYADRLVKGIWLNLLEGTAIKKYLNKNIKEHPQLTTSLIAVHTPEQAVNVASMDLPWAMPKETTEAAVNFLRRMQEGTLTPNFEEIRKSLGIETTPETLVDDYGVEYSKDGKRLLRCQNEGIREYIIKDGTEEICTYAFAFRYEIRNILIPESVVRIGVNAFHKCWNIKKLVLPSNLAVIDILAFWKVGGLERIDSCNVHPPICDDSSIDGDNSMTCIVYVPEGSKEAYSKAKMWRRFRHIVEYNSSKEVAEANTNAFLAKEATTHDLDSATEDVHGVLYDYDMVSQRLLKCNNKDLTQYTIASGTASICESAFQQCSLQEINFPQSVKIVGQFAFYLCYELSKVDLGEVDTIGNHAFQYCDIQTLVIPKTLTFMGDYCFAQNKKLRYVQIENGLTRIGYYAFWGCARLAVVRVPISVTIVEDYAFTECKGLQNIILSNPTPPICEDYSFKDVPTNTCVLSVPKGSKEAYSTAEGWKDFENIVEV